MLVGFPLLRKRRKAWENLYGSLESINGPWICFVDLMGDAEGTSKAIYIMQDAARNNQGSQKIE